jgi:serine/threonine-protein kinase HipA
MMQSQLYADLHFLTQRFDRDNQGEKIHVHSLCGLLGLNYHNVGSYSYEQYFMVARKLGLGQDTLEEMFRRMVFNVLAHNCDDHTKNFSFQMDRKGRWSLSPAFDLCYSYDSANDWVNGHNMRVNDKRKAITFRDLMTVGEKFNIKRRRKIFKKVKTTLDTFVVYAKKNKVDRRLQVEVEKNRPRINEE